MADDDKSKEDGVKDSDSSEEKAEMTMAEVAAILKEIMPAFKQMQETIAAMGTTNDTDTMDEDTKEKDGDQSEAKDKKGAMDAAEITSLKDRLAKVEGRGVKDMLSALTARDKIVKGVTPYIGTFDHAEMTTEDVVAYACDKLDIKVTKGHEEAALAGFIAGKNSSAGAVGFAQDAVKTGGLLEKTLKKA